MILIWLRVLVLAQFLERELFQLVDLLLERVDLNVSQDGVTSLPGGDDNP